MNLEGINQSCSCTVHSTHTSVYVYDTHYSHICVCIRHKSMIAVQVKDEAVAVLSLRKVGMSWEIPNLQISLYLIQTSLEFDAYCSIFESDTNLG